jgi:hypothetical protein
MKNLQNFDSFLNEEEIPMGSQPTPPEDGGKLGFFGRWAKQILGIPNTVPAKFNVDNYPEWKRIKDALIPTGKFTLFRSIVQPTFTYNDVSDDWSSEELYANDPKVNKRGNSYFGISFPAQETEGSDPDFSKVRFINFASPEISEEMNIKNPDAIIAKAKKEIGK